MSIRLSVISNDQAVESLFIFVRKLTPEQEIQLSIMERAITWLKTLDRSAYGFSKSPSEITASLDLDDNPQSNSILHCIESQPEPQGPYDHNKHKSS
jgi:hypothetical protein